jgi:PAS domain S-box-containing protein
LKYTFLTIGLFFFFLISAASTTGSKGFPYIKNFDLSNNLSNAQSWMGVQAKNGFMYFASTAGLREFDGVSWRVYPLPNKSTLRSVATDSTGRVYVGGTREFGYFFSDHYGRMTYYSLSSRLDSIDFEAVWRVLKTSNGVYFVAGRKYLYKFSNNRLTLIQSPPVINELRASVVKDIIYFYDTKAGFGFVEHDTLRLFKASQLPDDYVVNFFMEGKGQRIIAGVREKGVFGFFPDLDVLSWEEFCALKENENMASYPIGKAENGSVLHEINADLNKRLAGSGLYYGRHDENTYYLATLRKGVVVVDDAFRLINQFKRNSGIDSDAVFHVCIDNQKGCWFSGEMGISYVRGNSPITYINQMNGIEGSIISSYSTPSGLYVGTTQGLYLLDNNSDDELHKASLVTGEYIYMMDFEPMDDFKHGTLVSSLRNIHFLNTETHEFKTLFDIYGTYDIIQVPQLPHVYLFGHTEGILAYEITVSNGMVQAKKIPLLSQFSENVRGLLFDGSNHLWISTALNGVFQLHADSLTSTGSNSSQPKKVGLPDLKERKLFLLNDTIFAAGTKGLFYYSKSNESFLPYRSFEGSELFDSIEVKEVAVTREKVWMGLDKGLISLDRDKRTLNKQLFNKLGTVSTEHIDVGKNGNVYLSALSQLVVVNQNKLGQERKKVAVSFRDAIVGDDSLYAIDLLNAESNVFLLKSIPFSHNSLNIKLACPAYHSIEDLRFSYHLSGLNSRWSELVSTDQLDFSYLPHGDFVLKVHAVDVDQNVIGTASLYFTVENPIYLTYWAFLIYIALAALIVYVAIQLNSSRLKKEQLWLQRRIDEAVAVVRQQKEELEQQAQYLSNTNRELEKLSAVAEFTDNAVAIMDGKGNYQYINKGFQRMYGYSFYELINDAQRGKIGRNANLRINDLINIWFGDKKPIIYESLNKCKDDNELCVQTVLTPILDANGNVKQLISIDTDISKLKQAEKQIAAQRDEIQSQRDLAISQRDEIIVQKQEITDSIRYAQRIQTALFPSKEVLTRIFSENFILDRPRDIVSGDFFWTHRIRDTVLLAVADCTGHGVPGAFMSIIGLNFLNDIVINGGIHRPDIVLNILRENIIDALSQTDRVGDNKDGMDIALIAFDTQKRELLYAGANNSSILRRGDELITLDPDKMPISIFRDIKLPFTLQKMEVQHGDVLYMYTDGYVDQFGGQKGKKIKTNNFRKLLLNLPVNDLGQQEKDITLHFDKWRGELEQVDDVMVVGVKL